MNQNAQLVAGPSHIAARKIADRRGVTASEFALVTPLLFLFFFGAFEFCRVAMIRHTADNAVYEGCRLGVVPGATNGEAEAEVRRILGTIGVDTANVDVSPGSIDQNTQNVTVRVEVPLDENSFVPNQFVAGKSIVRELSMRREGK